MEFRKPLLATLLATFVVGASGLAAARTDVDFYVNIGPPPPVYEVTPPPRVGYVWAPGYWGWNGHRHVWHRGHWMHERRGYAWAPHHWEQHGDRWYMSNGRWERRY